MNVRTGVLFRVGKTLLSIACVCCGPAHSASLAGDYPVKPIRLVVPFPEGGLDASSKQVPAERGAGTRSRDATVKLATSASFLAPAPCTSPGSDPRGNPLPPCDAPRLRDANVREWDAAAALIAQVAVPSPQYPNRPIRLIVPFPPGGGTDIVARTVSAKLTEAWGQQIIIDNRGGAGGVIGADTVAKSTPDGYTLLFGTPGALIINPLLNSKLPYDSVRDFAPVSLLALNPQLLAVHSSLPVGTVKELIALAKARPGKMNYASVGEGTPNHLAMELFKSMTGTDIAHIPYKGAAPAVTDLLGGQVQVMFNPMPPLMPHVKSGKLKALAVGSTRRSSALPDIPTVAEAGVPGYEYVTWYSIVAPAKTPQAVILKINAGLAAVMSNPDVAQRLASQGAEPRTSTPAELAKFIQEDFKRLGSVIRSAGIRVE